MAMTMAFMGKKCLGQRRHPDCHRKDLVDLADARPTLASWLDVEVLVLKDHVVPRMSEYGVSAGESGKLSSASRCHKIRDQECVPFKRHIRIAWIC
jgi:hypothetical protein